MKSQKISFSKIRQQKPSSAPVYRRLVELPSNPHTWLFLNYYSPPTTHANKLVNPIMYLLFNIYKFLKECLPTPSHSRSNPIPAPNSPQTPSPISYHPSTYTSPVPTHSQNPGLFRTPAAPSKIKTQDDPLHIIIPLSSHLNPLGDKSPVFNA